jgi:hypothetical protein
MAQQQKAQQRPPHGSAPLAVSVDAEGDVIVSSADLPIPSNIYDADYAWPQIRNGAVSLFFAKASAGDDSGLRSRLEVRLPMESFIRHFWQSSREFHAQVRTLVQQAGWRIKDREHPKPEKLRPKNEHSVWANLDSMSRHGTAASIDFYHLAPDALVRFSRTRDLTKVTLEPIVRVLTTLSEALSLLDESAKIAEEVKPLIERAEPLVGPAPIVGQPEAKL